METIGRLGKQNLPKKPLLAGFLAAFSQKVKNEMAGAAGTILLIVEKKALLPFRAVVCVFNFFFFFSFRGNAWNVLC